AIDALAVFLCLFGFWALLGSSIDSDGLSLLALKAAVAGDPNQALVSWSEKDWSPCRWAGVSCDGSSGRVVGVSLSGKNLTGYIPSEIGSLEFLAWLDVSGNGFRGTLPRQVFDLRRISHLDISSNGFSGSIPDGLADLKNLTGTLNLSHNAFSGEVPASLGRLPVMVSLDVSYNNLTGKVPQVGSLLNQGPTAFSGNPYLCGFPLRTPCAAEPRIPDSSSGHGNPAAGVPSSRKRKLKNGGGVAVVAVIFAAPLAILLVSISAWAAVAKRRHHRKTSAAAAAAAEDGKTCRSGEEVIGKNGRFVALDEEFGLELEDLLRASAYVLGKSKSGILYRVVVAGGGGSSVVSSVSPAVVTVRRLSDNAPWNLKEFESEVEAIARVRHPNIVKLMAYYYAPDEKLLISEFIPNGTLHAALHEKKNHHHPPLTWASRLRICQQVAMALTHIHESTHRKFVHGDLTSSKILLDDDLKPYVSGFGLHRLSRRAKKARRKTTGIGTAPYAAPEAAGDDDGKPTQKCDVYSFGILLMELLTGRTPGGEEEEEEGIEERVREAFREERRLAEIVDPRLLGEVDAKPQVVAMFHVALSCAEVDPEARPRMRTVAEKIECVTL
ncbi:hypothetical protein M569_04990, partial [Genlisea aurea]